MNTATLLLVGAPVIMLAWFNGANDESKDVTTLVGDGLCDARRAICWGTLFTVLGGSTGILWGGVLVTFRQGIVRVDRDAAVAALFAAFATVFCSTISSMRI
jgi:phosphate/sulfate permease